MAKMHRSPLAVLLLAAACYVLSLVPGFVAPAEVTHAAHASAEAVVAGIAPLNEASSVLTADLSLVLSLEEAFVIP